MRSAIFFVVLAGALCTCRGDGVEGFLSDKEWNYTSQNAWKHVPGWSCNGLRQSPINIDLTNLVIDSKLDDLTLWNYDQYYTGSFSNTGHSVRFDPADNSPAALFQNHLGTYELKQFHFHWGNNITTGSEHQVNGVSFSGELHFVHQKTTGVPSTGDAYAVLGVLLIGDSSVPVNDTWKPLFNHVPKEEHQVNEVHDVRPSDFLPRSLRYYHYEGSLTTPPCSELVQWFVLQQPLHVPAAYMLELHHDVHGEGGEPIKMNYRYTQPLNGRQVMVPPVCDDNDYDRQADNGDQL